MRLLPSALRFTRSNRVENERKTAGTRLKRNNQSKIADLPISNPLSPRTGLQSVAGPMYGYFSPEDVGRATLRVTNPDARSVGSLSSSNLVPTIATNTNATEHSQWSRIQDIMDLQAFPAFIGSELVSEPDDTVVGTSSDRDLSSSSMENPRTSDNGSLNPLRANPPSFFQGKHSVSEVNPSASSEPIVSASEPVSQTETSRKSAPKRPKNFNPVTEEDCPRDAHPSMHGPGSRFFLYSQPETFRASSSSLVPELAAHPSIPKSPEEEPQQYRPYRRLPLPEQVPNPQVIHATILPISRHRQGPSNGEPDPDEQENPHGHYVDHPSLSPPGVPIAPLAIFSEATEARQESNLEHLKERARHALETMVPTKPLSSRLKRSGSHHRDIKDLRSFPKRLRRSSSGLSRWDDYAVVENIPPEKPQPSRSLPSFSAFRLSLSRTLDYADAAGGMLRQGGYFTARHQKRQEFLRRSWSKMRKEKKTKRELRIEAAKEVKKDLCIDKAREYLEGALDDLGSFEFDFSAFGMDQ